MKRRLLLLVLLAAGVYGAQQRYGAEGLQQLGARAWESITSDSHAGARSFGPEPGRVDGLLRVASFHIDNFGEDKQANPALCDALAAVVRQFDVVAIQGIRANSQGVLPRFLTHVNATGQRYDYALGPRLGRPDQKEQYAFVFNTASVEIDRTSIYTLEDPDNRLLREPLVATFRARGPAADAAFTFTLVNVHVDPDNVYQELNTLVDVVRAVRRDARGEDDVILLGTLQSAEYGLAELGDLPHLGWAVESRPTNTQRTQQLDNILFDRLATVEYTGGCGVFDLATQLQLTLDEAQMLSGHSPVWAEFSVFEGGTGESHVARREP